MSYYYTYYLGYQNHEDRKIYPLGPYNYNHELCPVFCISASFTSDLYKDFSYLKTENASEKLKTEFSFENWDSQKSSMKMLEADKLPAADFIKKGYFLIEDVQKYEKDPDILNDEDECVFQECLSPLVYSNMLNNEILLGPSDNGIEFLNLFDEDEETEAENEVKHSVGEYMFYIYPDYYCKEYESFVIQQTIKNFELQLESSEDKIVVLLVEG